MKIFTLTACGLIAASTFFGAAKIHETNSLGMELVKVQPGQFTMGQAPGAKWMEGGEWDESPVRTVEISQPFLIGATEVTNAQYEQFDPAHRALRGKDGFSTADDEPVLFVSWEEAQRFCAWLSQREGKPYRLPTEAEWEYVARAGTTTAYSTGDTLPKTFWRAQSDYVDHRTNHKTKVSLKVKQSPPNGWGIYDLHGNVEEWCYDWYGPYAAEATRDPVGRATGYGRVTRGGSHNTDIYYLRSANRLSALPDDRSYYIGFRVVQAALPVTKPLPAAEPALVMRDVSQQKNSGTPAGYASTQPLFRGPRPYVKVPETAQQGPQYWFHNHDPAITYCDNGDLLAIWFSTQREWGPELTILGSRLRAGREEWDEPSLFFDLADRNDHAPALAHGDDGRLYHFNATGVSGWTDLATIMRVSDDNGATWSQPKFVKEGHGDPHGFVESVIKTREGRWMLPVDGVLSTEVIVSDDDGKTWSNPAQGQPKDTYVAGGKGHRIAGIHAAFVQLNDGSLLAFGRGANIDNRLAMSRSTDLGKTWTYAASEFPSIRAGQRAILKRLKEGPLMFVGFTDQVVKHAPFELGVQRGRVLSEEGLLVKDASGNERRVFGMFAAVSFDEGKTWPVKKLITPGGEPQEFFGHGWTKLFTTDDTHAEPMGYLAATQTPDGRIHLISSALHYEFNLAWLTQPMPVAAKKKSARELTLAPLFRDGAILQRDKPVPVWGWATPGEAIEVNFKSQSHRTTAGADGRWVVTLTPLAASAESAELRVKGREELRVKDVLVGDVWLGSGQSNMNWNVKDAKDAAAEMAAANQPLIRYFGVTNEVTDAPQTDTPGRWEKVSPETVGPFSAVGYYFARALQPHVGVPIGIIKGTPGGSGIEAWMNVETLLTSDASGPAMVETHRKALADFPENKKIYDAALAKWTAAEAKAKKNGKTFTEAKPRVPVGPKSRNAPAGLYNSTIHPLKPYAIRGFLWYQGEANASRFRAYRNQFPAMITQWRRDFHQGDLPFLFVQLANFDLANDPTGRQWAFQREAQAAALALPQTAMAVTIDVGEAKDIHPRNKQEVGRRLALLARQHVYGEKIAGDSPRATAFARQGAAMRVTLENAAGLTVKGKEIADIELAGADKKFHPAMAVVDGESLVVLSSAVSAPVAVRYLWRNAPEATLFNGAGLPVAPFRSDSW